LATPVGPINISPTISKPGSIDLRKLFWAWIIRYSNNSFTLKANTDIWSLACIIFELLTNNYLFKPKKGEGFGKSDVTQITYLYSGSFGINDGNPWEDELEVCAERKQEPKVL
jgi:serine/threonine protein kinase